MSETSNMQAFLSGQEMSRLSHHNNAKVLVDAQAYAEHCPPTR
jgi:hypothetical protein